MSNDWDLFCVTCNVGAGMSLNHGEEDLARILNDRERLAAVGNVPGVTVELWGEHHRIPQFFAAHEGHVLTVRSEYGYDFGDCATIARCACCDRQFACKLPKAHDGDHAPTSPPPDAHASCRRSFERVLAERNAMIDASEEKRLVALADEMDDDNRATDARLLRSALAELGRYRTAAKSV